MLSATSRSRSPHSNDCRLRPLCKLCPQKAGTPRKRVLSQMLVQAVDQLAAMTRERMYPEAANLLQARAAVAHCPRALPTAALETQAVNQLLLHFEAYREVKKVNDLRDQISEISDQLRKQAPPSGCFQCVGRVPCTARAWSLSVSVGGGGGVAVVLLVMMLVAGQLRSTVHLRWLDLRGFQPPEYARRDAAACAVRDAVWYAPAPAPAVHGAAGVRGDAGDKCLSHRVESAGARGHMCRCMRCCRCSWS